jgi:hypothetical protein
MNATAATIDTLPSTAALPLPRIDLYGPVHRGLRSALTTVLARIGATDVSDCTRLATMLDDLEGVLYLCASHLAHENAGIHTAVDRRQPGFIARFDEEHRDHEHAIAELRALALALGVKASDRDAIHRTLYLRFSQFVAENLAHMVREETEIGPLLEALYSQQELEQIHGALLASIGPDEMLAFMRVMIPANPQPVRIGMLRGAQASMPREAFIATVHLFRNHLDAAEWIDLTTQLDVPA